MHQWAAARRHIVNAYKPVAVGFFLEFLENQFFTNAILDGVWIGIVHVVLVSTKLRRFGHCPN
jgi:hypothetical protein